MSVYELSVYSWYYHTNTFCSNYNCEPLYVQQCMVGTFSAVHHEPKMITMGCWIRPTPHPKEAQMFLSFMYEDIISDSCGNKSDWFYSIWRCVSNTFGHLYMFYTLASETLSWSWLSGECENNMCYSHLV